MNDRPLPEQQLQRIHGRTLGEAMRNVRRRFGDQARILETRTIARPATEGRGPREVFEVVVMEPETPENDMAQTRTRRRPPLTQVLQRLADDVARLEGLAVMLQQEADTEPARVVTTATTPQSERQRDGAQTTLTSAGRLLGNSDGASTGELVHPLARQLLARGASLSAVTRLTSLLTAERPAGKADPGQARAHLGGLLRTSDGHWGQISGAHLWIGPPGAGRTTLVLSAAAALARHGRRVLALQLVPRDEAEVQRLRTAADAGAFDAAVLRDTDRFPQALSLAGHYDVVLVDGPPMSSNPPPNALVQTDALHRHLIVPVDSDPYGRERAWTEARRWHCDWLTLTRLDLAPRPGQLLDLLLAAPLPVSLIQDPGRIAGGVALATPALLLSRMLGDEPTAVTARQEVEPA